MQGWRCRDAAGIHPSQPGRSSVRERLPSRVGTDLLFGLRGLDLASLRSLRNRVDGRIESAQDQKYMLKIAGTCEQHEQDSELFQHFPEWRLPASKVVAEDLREMPHL
uniref:Uncharacterized protein n=1 Tax=Sphaerodactylus townsendi TaxID=933632 RepID=A0ACB8F048_9SAUR